MQGITWLLERACRRLMVPALAVALLPSAVLAETPEAPSAGAAAREVLRDLKPGHWAEVPDSKMSSVFYKGPLAEQIYAATGPRSVIAAWGGAAYDAKREKLVLMGGGHGNYAGNEVYAFDMAALRWTRLTDPSSVAGYDGSGIYPDKTPASQHTYNHLAYIPDPVDRLFDQGGARFANGYADPFTWLFDIARKKWQRRADSPTSGYGDITAYDPVTGHVWMEVAGTHGYLLDYDPVADRWSAHGSQFSDSINIYTTGALDPERRLLVAVGGKAIYSWHLSPSPIIAYTTPKTDGGAAVEGAVSPGFVYYPQGREFVAWVGGATVYTLDPTLWKWTAHPPASDNAVTPPAPNATGTFGRFQYVASEDVFILVNDADQNVYLYRPDFGQTRSSAHK